MFGFKFVVFVVGEVHRDEDIVVFIGNARAKLLTNRPKPSHRPNNQALSGGKDVRLRWIRR
jgi:hypothetical protein